MVKDDYHVIVYQILAYLYGCLKSGEEIIPEILQCDSEMLNINHKYWTYILEGIQEQGYVKNVKLTYVMGYKLFDADVSRCQITPKGIEYLCEDSTLKKACKFLKNAKKMILIDII